MKTFELSEKQQNGERHFKLILLKIHPDSCVVGTECSEFNENGITWIEEYVNNQKDSLIGKSITCEFLDEDRTELYGHGDGGVEDGIPVFPNATVIGHFTSTYIEEVEIDGVMKKCLIGEGIIDNFRYKALCDKLDERLGNGETIYGSVEIFKKDENDTIVYKYGWKETGRIPTEFVFSGYALLSVRPADSNARLLELNSDRANNKEEIQMNETELKAVITETIVATLAKSNAKNEALENTIKELNSKVEGNENIVSEKEQAVAELEACKKEKEELEAEKNSKIAKLEEKVSKLQGELDACKKQEKCNEMNEAIAKFSEEEVKYAEVEINSFKENPLEGNIDSVVSKIYEGIGMASKEKQIVTEQNSASEQDNTDIYGDMADCGTVSDEDAIVLI